MTTKNNLMIAMGLCVVVFMACEDDSAFISPALDGVTMDIEVGGPSQPNQVFVNLFEAGQVSVDRSSWDLGFFSGSDFRVIINPSAEILVKELSINDLSQVTEQDTVGMGSMLSFDAIFNAVLLPPPPGWVSESVSWVDDPSGDLTGTAIAEISATASSNNVYIVNRGVTPTGQLRGWLKFRVVREGTGYAIQYAPISSASFETFVVPKLEDYNFNYFNFDTGLVDVEPTKESWEISFNTNVQILNFGVNFPYRINDFVTINSNNTSVAEVIVGTDQTLAAAFEEFSLSAAQGLAYNSDRNAIGSNWRTVASPTPGSVTAVRSDRFYVIRSHSGSYFKLIFTAMLNDAGERGYPQIQYQLLE